MAQEGLCTKIIQSFVYLALLCLGVYFIYLGEILQKFQLQRTNFAEIEEPVSEFPTIFLFIDYRDSNSYLEYEKGFKISFKDSSKPHGPTKLKIGLNNLQGSELKLHLDTGEIIADDTSWNPYQGFRITPLDFKVGMSLEYDLRFHFENQTEDLVSTTSISLTSEKNSYCPSMSRLQQDGKAQYLFSKTGYYNLVVITSEKYKYINNGKCREMSYTEIVFEQVSEIIHKKCHQPCRPKEWFCNFGKDLSRHGSIKH